MSRQTDRREHFQSAFAKMPKFETWTTETGKISATFRMIEGRLKLTDVSATRHHVKIIPRRVRRSMARALAKREFRATREL